MDIQYLYKYRPVNQHTKRIITHNELYFPSPNEFNDPFDCKIPIWYEGGSREDISTMVRNALPELSTDEQNQIIEELLKNPINKLDEDMLQIRNKNYGICSLTEKKDDILMWSHYAENHSGICLEFKVTTDSLFGSAQKVKYDESYPVIRRFDSSAQQQFDSSFLTKSKQWEYEKEWRIIKKIENQQNFKFPKHLLTGVILGCKVTYEGRKQVLQWLKEGNSKAKLYKAFKKDKEFGLDIKPISLMRGDEILVLMAQAYFCERFYRKRSPESVSEEIRPYFEIFRSINISLEHLVLTAIEMINLYQAYTFNEETQHPGYYRSTLLRQVCVPIHEFNVCLNESIIGKDFINSINRISDVFSDEASLKVPKAFRKILKNYNQFMQPRRKYFKDLRNIACHKELDIDTYISHLEQVDEEKIRIAFHRTLEFILEFLKVYKPLEYEFLESHNLR